MFTRYCSSVPPGQKCVITYAIVGSFALFPRPYPTGGRPVLC